MADSRVSMMDRGQTETGLAHLAGIEKEVADRDPSDRMKLRSNRTIRLRRVLNDSGGALLPKRVVQYKAAGWGTTIGGYAGATERGDGVVDEFLPAAGVADGAYFWMVVDGPTEFVSNGAGALAQGDVLVTAADGKVVEQTAAPAQGSELAQVNARVGYSQETAAATDGLAFLGEFHRA